MKKYRTYYILLYTMVVLACIALIVNCGNPHKHKKMKKHKMEMRMKNDTIHNDSIRQARMKMWKERKKHKKDSRK